MPAYRTHVKVNFLLALPLSLLALKKFGADVDELGLFAGSFLYGTLFLHPDLDVARKISPFSIRGLLSLPFWPYSFLFRHRGISHIPLLGTLTRVLWLYGVLLLLAYFFKGAYPILNLGGDTMALVLAGFAVADLSHELLDQINSG